MIKTIELKMRFVATFTLRHYLSDLNIDFEFIQTHNPERFIWITHDCGTHFIRFWKTEELPSSGQCVPYLFGTADREHIVNNELETLRNCSCEEIYDFYLIEPPIGTFKKIRKKEAVAMLENHVQQLHELWKGETANESI